MCLLHKLWRHLSRHSNCSIVSGFEKLISCQMLSCGPHWRDNRSQMGVSSHLITFPLLNFFQKIQGERGTSEACMVCQTSATTVRAVEHHWRSVINASALSAEDPTLPASACGPPHTRAHQSNEDVDTT